MTNTSGTDQQAVFNSLKDKPPDVWITYLRQNEDGEQTPGLSFDVIIHYAYSRRRNIRAWSGQRSQHVLLSCWE